MGIEVAVMTAKFRVAFREDRLVAFALLQRGLMCRTPGSTVLAFTGHIAQVTEGTPGVTGAVFAPARHGQILPAAVAATGVCHHHMITAVGQQLDFGDRRVGGVQHAYRHLRTHLAGLDGADFRGMHIERRGPGDAFLQQ